MEIGSASNSRLAWSWCLLVSDCTARIGTQSSSTKTAWQSAQQSKLARLQLRPSVRKQTFDDVSRKVASRQLSTLRKQSWSLCPKTVPTCSFFSRLFWLCCWLALGRSSLDLRCLLLVFADRLTLLVRSRIGLVFVGRLFVFCLEHGRIGRLRGFVLVFGRARGL